MELTQDITDWTNKDVTVTIKTSTDCVAPEGWKQVNKRTFTKVFNANGEYSVTLTSVTGDAHLFSITNIDKEAPVIDYAAIESANGYRKEIPVNEGEEYTEEKLVEMFTKPEWVSDNSGTATFKVDNGDWNTVWMDISHLHPRHLANIKFVSMHTMQPETTAVLMFM